MPRIKARKSCIVVVFLLLIFSQSIHAQRIDMDFYNTDIQVALRLIAAQQGVSIIPDKDISGKITLHLSNVEFEEGLSMLAQTAGLVVSKDGAIYRLGKAPSFDITHEDGLLTLWANSVDIKELLWNISRSTGETILFDETLSGSISINAEKMTVDTILQAIAESNGYSISKSGSIYIIRGNKAQRDIKSEVLLEDGGLTLDISGMDIRAALALISTKTGINILAEKNISGNVSIFIHSMPLEDALEAFALANGLAIRKEGDAFFVFDPLKNYYVNYKQDLLTLRAQNADIRSLVTEISLKTGETILLDKDVSGMISAYLSDLPLDSAIKRLTDSQGLRLLQEGGVYLIKRPQQASDFTVILGKDGRISLDIRGADLAMVLREIAEQTNIGLAIYGTTRVNINNIKVSGLTFTEALDLLLKGTPLTVKNIDDIYLIGDAMALRQDSLEFSHTKLIKLSYVPVEEVFPLLPASFPSQNLRLLKSQNSIIAIGTPQFITQLEEYIALIDNPTPEVIYKLMKINHLKAQDVLNLMPSYLKKEEIMVLKEQNTLVVTGKRTHVDEVERYIKAIDLPNPQIIFDVLIVEYVDRSSMKAGFSGDAKEGNYSIAYNLLSGGSPMVAAFTGAKAEAKDFNVTLNALIQEGKAKVRANPRIAALNGNEANFSVLTRSRYWEPRYAENPKPDEDKPPSTAQGIIRTIDTGIQLKLKPWVSGSGDITVEVEPSISDTAGTGTSGLPSTNERSVVTTVRVKDGQTIVIGGLIQTLKHESVSKLPLLGDLPILGHLFRSTDIVESETEFVIYITPHLIPETGFSGLDISEYGIDGGF